MMAADTIRINPRAASLQSPRPFSVSVSPSRRLSPKLGEPLVAGRNGRIVSTYSRSPSRSPCNTLRGRVKRKESFETPSTVSKSTSAPDFSKLDRRGSNAKDSPEAERRRTAMMPVSNSTSTWRIVRNSRCLVNPDPIYGVYMNKNGEMYTTSETPKGGLVQCHDRNGNCLWHFLLRPYKNGKTTFQPFQIAETPEGNVVIACATSVTVWTKEGKLLNEHGKNMFKFCKNVAVRSTGEIIVTDSDSDCVKIIAANGSQITKLEYPIECAAGVAVDSQDNIIVTDWRHNIRVFDADNKLVRTFGERGNNDGELDMVYGVCTDCDDNIVVADMWNDRVSVYSNEGKFITHIANGHSAHMHRPLHVAVTRGTTPDDYRLCIVEFGGSDVKLLSY